MGYVRKSVMGYWFAGFALYFWLGASLWFASSYSLSSHLRLEHRAIDLG